MAKLRISAFPLWAEGENLAAIKNDLRKLVQMRDSIKDQLQMAKRQSEPEGRIELLEFELSLAKRLINETGASRLEIIEAGKRPAPVEQPVDTSRPHRVDRHGNASEL